MNEHLFTNNDGLRLISTFEGAPRLKARLCEGGRYELGYGVTFHLDGSPVLENQTCTEDQAMAMFRNALQRFEVAVLAHVTVPLNSNQFSALVAFAYNVGEANFAGSTVLRMVNQLRFEDAAAAFGMWVFATRDGYKQALRGLLRRRYAEACLFLSYDWVEACADEAVALQREKPATFPGADRVLYKTPFANILRVAQHYPLAESPEPAHAQVPVMVPTVLERVEVAPAPLQDSAIPSLQATIDGIPTQLPLPGEVLEDELVLDRPAATEASTEANGTAPPLTPQPSGAARVPHVNETAISEHDKAVVPKNPPSLNTNTGVSPPASAERLDPIAPSPPVALPSPLPPPKPPPVIAPKSIDIRSIPYGEMDPEQPPKNMTDSRRVIGMVVVGAGSLVQILAAREIVSSSVGAIFFDMSRDPVVVALFAGACMWVVGWLTRKRGTHIVAKGMVEATSLLK